MKTRFPSRNVLRFSACLLAGLRLTGVGLPGQTVELVGSASSAANTRVPVINDAGNVFYVNNSSYVIGNPATPIQRSFATVSTILAPGSGDTVPYVLSSNGTVTYISTTTLFQSNLTQKLTVAAGNAQAAGLGNPLIKYASHSPPQSATGVFD